MQWDRPEALYLILPLGVAWLVLTLLARARRRRAAEAFVNSAMWPRLLPAESPGRFWLKTALWEAALVLALVALAGPRFGSYYETVRPRGSDLYVLIDVSRSMLADDVPPSRLGRAKSDVSSLLNRLHGERVGLIAFAGKAVIKCPLTTDYTYFRQALEELDTNSAPRGGTAIGDAVRKALDILPREAERDQALLLITDGDDQQSYPLKAAELAAERHVMIFAVGLGDAEKGSRIPVGKDGATNFVEYKGEQVWSKLDNNLLSQMALATKGKYLPVGTRAYDLGQLYEDALRDLHAGGKEQRRVRLSEQYQLFLALALVCLMMELLIQPYAPRATQASGKLAAVVTLFALACSPLDARAADATQLVREGLDLYALDKFDEAREKFAQAVEEAKDDDTAKAVAAFDQACSLHRKGDTEKARENYLKAADTRDRQVGAEAHYNLGNLSAENARALAGEHPENVPPEKRGEIEGKLIESVRFLRQCLALQPQHAGARRNIELIRQWLKYYKDKWHEMDRQKMREQTNLLQFLEYVIRMQQAMRESTRELQPTATLDSFAELKRAQDELAEEIEPLKNKIRKDLSPPPQAQGQPAPTDEQKKQTEEAIKLLQTWADAAGSAMARASSQLAGRKPAVAADEQKKAVDELERIWDAVVPFHPLLGRLLANQTAIVHVLKPESADPVEAIKEKWQSNLLTQLLLKSKDAVTSMLAPEKKTERKEEPKKAPVLKVNDEETTELAELQETTARRTSLMKLKAEAELKQLEQAPAQPAPDPNAAQPQGPDPAKVKEGYQKAIELAPKAVEKMNSAARSLRNKKPDEATPDAEEAKRILEEIAKAQPKNPEQQKQDKKDEQKQDQKKEDQKKEETKDEQKQDKQKQDKQEQQELSQDQVQELLRKVREREKMKHERDKEIRARILGPAGVEKDW